MQQLSHHVEQLRQLAILSGASSDPVRMGTIQVLEEIAAQVERTARDGSKACQEHRAGGFHAHHSHRLDA